MFNKSKNVSFKKLTTVFLFSTISFCLIKQNASFADGFYGYPNTTDTKYTSPVYLDTSQTNKVTPIINTSIPYNLRQFDEADYFSSSSFDDSITAKQNSPPTLNFTDLISPSEYETSQNSITKKTEIVENIDEEHQESVFTPDYHAANFFAPVPGENTYAIKPESNITEVATIKNTVEKENVFEISKKTEQNIETDNSWYEAEFIASAINDNSNIEGLPIANIKINGLKTLSSENIISIIDTQKNSLYSNEIIQRDLQKIYATGYFTDEMSVEPILNPNKTIDLIFSVEENMIVNNVYIMGNTVIATTELGPFILNMKGKPQNLNNINKAIENISKTYHEKGYILANVKSVEDDNEGNLTFDIQEGIIDNIKISGNEKTQDYVILRNIMTQSGTVYNEDFLRKDLAKVFSTQIFDEVTREITPSAADENLFDLTVIVKEKSTDSIGFGGGIDTGLGAFGSISLKEDNFLGKGQRVSLSGILGSGILLSDASIKNHMNYQVELSFFEPYFINADNSLTSRLYYREMGSFNIPLAIEQRIGAMGGIEHKVKGHDHLTTSFMLGAEHIHLKEGDYNTISRLYAQNHLNITDRAKQLRGGFFLNLAPGIKYSKLDDYENPRKGIIAQARFNEAIGVSNINHTNGRLSGMITKFFPVFKKSTFSLTAKGGIKVHGDNMPEIMAYRLGGPYTIRGYRMHGVGAGESFVMGSAELATPLPYVDRLKWDVFKKMRLTFFVDAGKVFDPTITNVLFDRPEHAITAGIGLRIIVPGLGPISVDYGLPITNPGSYGSENGYFTFGTGGLNGMYGY